ncbi:MAG: UDP-N-acetylglucosamine 2-epimerase [Phycisphaerae bacterium]|nr:UDP-N-acetylglucosamine 2-epimerase [Phycisphaerae bacterium]
MTSDRPHPPRPTIGCVTTTRADYGIYRPLLAALVRNQRHDVIRFAGGTHLHDSFGRTIDDVRADDFGLVVPVEHFSDRDDPAGIAASAGRAVAAFGDAFSRQPLHLLFLLGDRYEMLAAAMAAQLGRVPIAHLHGGDTTAGAIDDAFRHAISKLAALHFPSLPEHARRLVAMGEADWRIHVTGALALDSIRTFRPEPVEALSAALELDFRSSTLLVCVHPETLSEVPVTEQWNALAEGIREFSGNVLVIGSNADEQFLALRRAITDWCAARPRSRFIPSLSQSRFWSCLAHASAMIGNSSAGIIESASFQLPVVNVGRRQEGRARSGNVLDVPWDAAQIAEALARALDAEYRTQLSRVKNIYGDGHAAERILEVLDRLPPRGTLLHKA